MVLRLILQTALWIAGLAALLFIPAGTVKWPGAWIFLMTGPYRYVRHPLYAGAILYFLGAPLLLGSWYGLALTPVMIAVLAVRALLEERMLKGELEGYAEYAARVR